MFHKILGNYTNNLSALTTKQTNDYNKLVNDLSSLQN